MQLGKKAQAAPVAPSSGLTFARKQDNGQVKSLNAKKLDIDFGGDDFFNSFQPAAPKEPEQSLFSVQKKAPQNAINTDVFTPVSAMSSTGRQNDPLREVDTNLLNQQAQERLRELGNRKAISSADFQSNSEMDAEMQSRFKALSGATQISSDMMFGSDQTQQNRQQNDGFNSQQLVENAQHMVQNAQQMASNASDFFSSIYSNLKQQASTYTSNY